MLDTSSISSMLVGNPNIPLSVFKQKLSPWYCEGNTHLYDPKCNQKFKIHFYFHVNKQRKLLEHLLIR